MSTTPERTGTAPGRVRGAARDLRRSTSRVLAWSRVRPVTLTIVALTAVLSILRFALRPVDWGFDPGIEPESGARIAHHWWSTLTSLFVIENGPALLAFLVLAIVAVGAAERVMGSLRTAIAYLVGGIAASFLGLAIDLFEEAYLPGLPLNAPAVDVFSPTAPLIATAVAASGFFSPLWRRRIRLLAVFTAVTLYLYSGGANDLFSLLAIPVGFVLGFALGARRTRGFRLVRSSFHEKRVLLSAIVAITAIGPVIATASGTGAGLLSVYGYLSVDPLSVVDGQVCAFGSPGAPCPGEFDTIADLQGWSGIVALLPLIVLLLAAWGIRGGRRIALSIAVVVNLLIFAGMLYTFAVVEPETVAAIGEVLDADTTDYVWQTLTGVIVGALVPLLVAVALVLFRGAARVSTATRAKRTFVVTVGGTALGVLAVSLVAALLAPGGFRPVVDAAVVLRGLPLRLVPPTLLPSDILEFVPESGLAQALWYLPSLLFWLVLTMAVALVLLNPAAVQDAPDRRRARTVLERGGGDTLSFMSTWRGNSYWFAPQADAAIAYRVRGAIAVTLGGPFGPDHDRPDVAAAFVEFCGAHGWTAVFYSVDTTDGDGYDRLGWQRMPVAEEAVLRLPDWNTAGKKRQDIRTATNRAAREGIAPVWTSWQELSSAQLAQIRDISEAWVADRSLPEMEFTLGGVDELDDPAVRLMLAVHESGRIDAVTSWMPMFGPDGVTGYTLDFMRRRGDSMNGIMEFVIGAAADRMKADGLALLSLSGSPLASTRLDDDAARSNVARLLDLLGSLLEPAYGFRSLLNFKRKFQPEFVPLYAVYPDATVLPALGVALTRCYLPTLTLGQAVRMAGSLREPRPGERAGAR
ncbi:phosphatidylglycerol lysyltransferase domain-containing protein [Microbacterium radiodurans]|nr:phosphatidylglycerol lysyltransferase domain-containing protein [Microbacterium radiodurans]